MNQTYYTTRRACIAKLRALAAQEGHDGEPWETMREAAELLMLECREEDAERAGELPTSGILHSIDITDEGTAPFRKGKRRAFAMVSPTCPAVDRAFDNLLTELIELGLCQSPEHDAEIDAILCRARIRVKQQGTELLRRALVFACEEWAAGESCQRKLELLQSLQTQLADPARTWYAISLQTVSSFPTPALATASRLRGSSTYQRSTACALRTWKETTRSEPLTLAESNPNDSALPRAQSGGIYRTGVKGFA